MAIQLGDKVSAKVSGFVGIARAFTQYDNGCRRIGVQPKGLDKEGKPFEWVWFDEEDLTASPISASGGPQRPVPPKQA